MGNNDTIQQDKKNIPGQYDEGSFILKPKVINNIYFRKIKYINLINFALGFLIAVYLIRRPDKNGMIIALLQCAIVMVSIRLIEELTIKYKNIQDNEPRSFKYYSEEDQEVVNHAFNTGVLYALTSIALNFKIQGTDIEKPEIFEIIPNDDITIRDRFNGRSLVLGKGRTYTLGAVTEMNMWDDSDFFDKTRNKRYPYIFIAHNIDGIDPDDVSLEKIGYNFHLEDVAEKSAEIFNKEEKEQETPWGSFKYGMWDRLSLIYLRIKRIFRRKEQEEKE